MWPLFTKEDIFRMLLLLLILMPMVTVMIFFIADLDCKTTLWSLGSIVQLLQLFEITFTVSEIRVLAIQALRKDTQQPPTIALNWEIFVIFIFVFNIFLSEPKYQIPKYLWSNQTLLLKCKTFCTNICIQCIFSTWAQWRQSQTSCSLPSPQSRQVGCQCSRSWRSHRARTWRWCTTFNRCVYYMWVYGSSTKEFT